MTIENYIPVRASLRTNPKTVCIAGELEIDPDEVVGKLVHMWTIAGEHTSDGVLAGYNTKLLDGIIGLKGWSEALVKVGWLIIRKDALICPEWDRWNGKCARARLEDARRKAFSRPGKSPGQTPEKVRTNIGSKAATESDDPGTKNDNDSGNDNGSEEPEPQIDGSDGAKGMGVQGERDFSPEELDLLCERYEWLINALRLKKPEDFNLAGKVAVMLIRGHFSEHHVQEIVESVIVKRPRKIGAWLHAAFAKRYPPRPGKNAEDSFLQGLAEITLPPELVEPALDPCADGTARDNRD